MRYKFVIPTLYIFSTLTLFAQGDKLGDVLQKVGKKQTLVPPIKEKKKTKKKSRFIFKDTYETNIIGSIDKNTHKKNTHQKKSKNDENENKPRFKFKFTPGTGYSNIIVGHNTSPIGAGQGGGASGGSYGGGASSGSSGGGQGKGRRR